MGFFHVAHRLEQLLLLIHIIVSFESRLLFHVLTLALTYWIGLCGRTVFIPLILNNLVFFKFLYRLQLISVDVLKFAGFFDSCFYYAGPSFFINEAVSG